MKLYKAILDFVGHIATEIRMNSAYNQNVRYDQKTAEAIMWLSDSIHNVGLIGEAISNDNDEDIIKSCEAMLENLISNSPRIIEATNVNGYGRFEDLKVLQTMIKNLEEFLQEKANP